MSASKHPLVEQLQASGEWPQPELLRTLHAEQDAVRESLVEVLRQRPNEVMVCFAARLLGSFGDPAVIPDLVKLFDVYTDETLEDVAESLALLGSAAVDPLLQIANDPRRDAFSRSDACTAAILAARNNPTQMAQVIATLRTILREQLSQANTLSIPDNYLATTASLALANLGDHASRPLIDEAYRAGRIDGGVIRPQEVDELFARGGEPIPEVEPTEWLTEYGELYQREQVSRASRTAAMAKHTRSPEAVLQPIYNGGQKQGRNELCWCGSGKKFKNCHRKRGVS